MKILALNHFQLTFLKITQAEISIEFHLIQNNSKKLGIQITSGVRGDLNKSIDVDEKFDLKRNSKVDSLINELRKERSLNEDNQENKYGDDFKIFFWKII